MASLEPSAGVKDALYRDELWRALYVLAPPWHRRFGMKFLDPQDLAAEIWKRLVERASQGRMSDDDLRDLAMVQVRRCDPSGHEEVIASKPAYRCIYGCALAARDLERRQRRNQGARIAADFDWCVPWNDPAISMVEHDADHELVEMGLRAASERLSGEDLLLLRAMLGAARLAPKSLHSAQKQLAKQLGIDEATLRQRWHRLKKRIRRQLLTEQEWRVYQLIDIQGRRHALVADELGTSREVVEKLLFGARAKLQKRK
jgi:hypothetical protein